MTFVLSFGRVNFDSIVIKRSTYRLNNGLVNFDLGEELSRYKGMHPLPSIKPIAPPPPGVGAAAAEGARRSRADLET